LSRVVRMPRLGANEESARLVHWSKRAGDLVRPTEVICEVETTKAVVEVEAEAHGYLRPIAQIDSLVPTGEVLAIVTETADEDYLPLLKAAAPTSAVIVTSERRWTKKAEIIARRASLKIEEIADSLPGQVIGEADVEQILAKPRHSSQPISKEGDGNFTGVERVLILGGAAGGGAALILDALAHSPAQRAIGILDRDPALHGETILGVPVLGSSDRAAALWSEGAYDAAVIAFNRDLRERQRVFDELVNAGIRFGNVIDPSARIGLGARLGTGNVVLGFCRVGPFAEVGDNNFLSAYVSIEHHCRLGSHCAFGPSVAFSGFVSTGDRVRFGTAIGVEPRVGIGSDTIIASGAVITRDVPANSIVKARANVTIRQQDQGAN
jgi:sugar O-acyltransferase (sialic acid O-acetyltransferase NeuD family)